MYQLQINETQRSSLAKFTVYEILSMSVPPPSQFETQNFTLVAMGNFDNAGKNTLSGMNHAHDTCPNSFLSKAKNLEI